MSFPAIRMRRMRRDAFSRALMRETTLLVTDLIMVAFVIEGEGQREPVPGRGKAVPVPWMTVIHGDLDGLGLHGSAPLLRAGFVRCRTFI